jgi:hypothetical protein
MKSQKSALRELTTSGLKEKVLKIVKSALVVQIAIKLVLLSMRITNVLPVIIVRRIPTHHKLALQVLSVLNKEVMNVDLSIILEAQSVEFQPHVSTVLEVSSANHEQQLSPKFAKEVLSAQLDQLKKKIALQDITAQLCQKLRLFVHLDISALVDLLNTENVQLVLIALKEVPSQFLALQVTTDQATPTTLTLLLDVQSVEEVFILSPD